MRGCDEFTFRSGIITTRERHRPARGRRPATGSAPVAGPAERAAVGHRADQPVRRRSPSSSPALFDRHAATVHRYLGRRVGDLADDLLSETFLVAFRRRAAYRPEHVEVRPWLIGIATNLVHGHVRAERRRYRALARAGGRARRPGADPADVARPARRRRRSAARSRRRWPGSRPATATSCCCSRGSSSATRRSPPSSTSPSAPSAPGSTGPAGRPAPPSPLALRGEPMNDITLLREAGPEAPALTTAVRHAARAALLAEIEGPAARPVVRCRAGRPACASAPASRSPRSPGPPPSYRRPRRAGPAVRAASGWSTSRCRPSRCPWTRSPKGCGRRSTATGTAPRSPTTTTATGRTASRSTWRGRARGRAADDGAPDYRLEGAAEVPSTAATPSSCGTRALVRRRRRRDCAAPLLHPADLGAVRGHLGPDPGRRALPRPPGACSASRNRSSTARSRRRWPSVSRRRDGRSSSTRWAGCSPWSTTPTSRRR